MNLRTISTIVVTASLLGCASSHEGTYSPDCIAYAGSKISLSDGKFFWEKFTDAVVLDDDGQIVDQFPGYPMQGTYHIHDETVHMETAAGESIEEMYLHRRDDRQYLLTQQQFEAWRETGEYADCALMLGADN